MSLGLISVPNDLQSFHLVTTGFKCYLGILNSARNERNLQKLVKNAR